MKLSQIIDAASAKQILNPSLASVDPVPQWFAVYTVPNHEKRVARQLSERAIPYYLPLYESVRQWKDRKMRLKVPLFPGYVFVQMQPKDRLKVVQVPSVVRLVGFGGDPVAVPEGELMAIRMCVDHNCRMEPHPVLRAGQRVRITRGALAGIEGILVRRKGISRLVLSVGLIMRAVAVEVNVSDIAPVRSSVPNKWAKSLAGACEPDQRAGNAATVSY